MMKLRDASVFLICFAIAGGGCLIVPSTTTTTKKLGYEESAAIEGKARSLNLSSTATAAAVTIRATHTRECERQLFEVTELTKTKHARQGGAKDPRLRAFGVLFVPVTIPVSAAITGIALLASSPEKSRTKKLTGTKKFECITVAKGLPLEIEMPSGRIIENITDLDGQAEIAIPATEPYRGTVTTRTQGSTTEVTYQRPLPAISAMRDAVLGCAARHAVHGPLQLKIRLDSSGAVLNVSVDVGDATFSGCVAAGIRTLRFPEAYRGATLAVPFQLPGA